jgi:hypothetical protein
MTATGGRSSRDKGARAERELVEWLKANGVDARRTASGYHQDVGDIRWPGTPYLLDVKNRDAWRVREWWLEVTAEADELNETPLLVLRTGPNPADWLALLRFGDVAHGLAQQTVTPTRENESI